MALILLLVAAHAVLVPVHVAWAHGPDPHPAGAGAGGLHAHGPDNDHHDHHDDLDPPAAPSPPRSGAPEMSDASDYGEPHRHDTHAHGAADHGFARARGGAVIYYPPVLLASMDLEAPARATQTVAISEAPPPRAPTPPHPTLRGPPVG